MSDRRPHHDHGDPIARLRDAFRVIEPDDRSRDAWAAELTVELDEAAAETTPIPWRLLTGGAAAAAITIVAFLWSPLSRATILDNLESSWQITRTGWTTTVESIGLPQHLEALAATTRQSSSALPTPIAEDYLDRLDSVVPRIQMPLEIDLPAISQRLLPASWVY